MRSTFTPHASGVVAFGSGSSFRSGVGFGSRVSFGSNPRFSVFFGSRAFHRPHRFVYPYPYFNSYVYPYIVYPMYPLSYYDSYDYITPAQPTYVYDYATGEGNYPAEVGLNEQMRQQGVGIYAQQRAATPEPAPATTPAGPNREMPATVLIYRDGRRAEVHNYAIVGQTVWTFNERVATKIPLSSLDVESTRKANAERGMDFIVPQQ